jgi:hypothetical protein
MDGAQEPVSASESLREAFQAVFDAMGGAEALACWAHTHPTQFYLTLGRLLTPGAPAGAVPAEVSEVPLDAEPMSPDTWALSVRAWSQDGP